MHSLIRRGLFVPLGFVLFAPAVAAAQSPSTAAITVIVVDQTGAVVKDAAVTVENAQTAYKRNAVSLGDGSVTIGGLGLTGMIRYP